MTSNGVKGRNWLIKENYSRLVDECLRQTQALPHATAVAADGTITGVPKIELPEQLLGPDSGFAGIHPEQAGSPQEKLLARHVVVEGRGLCQVANPLSHETALRNRIKSVY
jgi:hypothetical protein